ncbi:hypothetical protein SLA2020_263510 [Shorea laevis]
MLAGQPNDIGEAHDNPSSAVHNPPSLSHDTTLPITDPLASTPSLLMWIPALPHSRNLNLLLLVPWTTFKSSNQSYPTAA